MSHCSQPPPFPLSHYTKAQQLMPKNGKAYNQLAVVAISAVSAVSAACCHAAWLCDNIAGVECIFPLLVQQRRLDAVYYYIRSLTAGTPFLGARESLLGLLHDTGSKVEYREIP